MKKIKDILDGRMNRKNYIKMSAILFIAAILIAIPLEQIYGQDVAWWAVVLIFCPLSFIIATKRFHDVGKSTVWAVGFLLLDFSDLLFSGIVDHILTVIQIILFLYLCTAKGDILDNEYGLAK